MRFGFSHHPAEHYSRHVDLIRHSEAIGFDTAWVPDQTYYRDPYMMLVACALATERIQLGLAVTNPFTRHPTITARCAATAAEFAPGRFQLGIGAGNRRELLDPLDLPLDDTPGRCVEATEIVRGLLAGDKLDYNGRHYRARGVELDFESEPVPIYIAGRGRRMLRAAGHVADGVIAGGLSTPEGVAYAWREIVRGAARSGRDAHALEVVSWVMCQVTDDRPSALDSARPMVAHIIGGAPADMLLEIGLDEGLVTKIKRAYAAGGKEAAAEHVTDACVDTFTLIGDADTCLGRIRTLEEAGVTQFGLLLAPGTVDQHRARLDCFAESVIAGYRS
jgi:5,10-methylenetetrahydromethanopterin reductase